MDTPSAARAVLCVVLLTTTAVSAGPQPARYDVIVRGGTIVDGSGAAPRRGDVGIRDGRIAALGTLGDAEAEQVIDAAGLVVAPGFIDVHTHADDLAERPAASNFVRMGVTSIVAGNCGSSAVDVGQALDRIRQIGAAVNFATLIGHNSVRRAVMGTENRVPRLPELNKMKSLVWRAMTDGAVGLSTGLQYVPGTYARLPEIVELARVAANAGGVYASHMRNEGSALEDAVAETINVGRLTGARVQISHLKVDSPRDWGAATKALALIDAARGRGVTVEADQYAYTAASSTLSIRFPSWALEGGQERIAARLSDPATWARVKREMADLLAERGLSDLSFAVVASYGADPSLNGLSMRAVAAKLEGAETADAQFEAARRLMLGGGASMVYHLMSQDDVDAIMRNPHVAIAADGSLPVFGEGMPHPRGYGNNARVLAEYVRERHVLTLQEAVRKMTSLPAAQFRFGDRGVLRVGYAADIVIFDPATVADTATFEQPHSYARGIPYVLVNGVPVVSGGDQTEARPGTILTSAPPADHPDRQ
jgi:N-acyl-D-amino-acid deacylase